MTDQSQHSPESALRDFGRQVMDMFADKQRGRRALARVQQVATPGDPGSVLQVMDAFARDGNFMMNVGDEKGPLLADCVRQAGNAPRILELGCFCGYSAVLMAGRLQDGGHLWSLEPDLESVAVARAIIAFAGLSDRVTVLPGKACDLIAGLTGPFDLVFLDHDKDAYQADMAAIIGAGLLRPGSIVFADNVGPVFRADQYLNWVRTHPGFTSTYHKSHVEYLTVEDGVEISVWQGED